MAEVRDRRRCRRCRRTTTWVRERFDPGPFRPAGLALILGLIDLGLLLTRIEPWHCTGCGASWPRGRADRRGEGADRDG